MRKTKIIATIGPASRDRDTLDRLIAAGMDCARLNFSHGTLEEHEEVIQTVRELSAKQGRRVAILQDLGGIKLSVGEIQEPIHLSHGDEVSIVAEEVSPRAMVIPFPEPEILQVFRSFLHLLMVAMFDFVRYKPCRCSEIHCQPSDQ